MNIFKQTEKYYTGMYQGILIGCSLVLLSILIFPSNPTKAIEIRIIEKPVIIKQPVYINSNDRKQIRCMVENAYYEAGNQSTSGVVAVNSVVLNRSKDKKFPSTPCGVINQKSHGVCQFSWKCQSHISKIDKPAYIKIKNITEDVYLGNYNDNTKGAQFYHAKYVNPSWSKIFNKTATIGNHVFYER